MKQILFLIFFITASTSCRTTVKSIQTNSILQGISGLVTEAKGNQMPMKGADLQDNKGLQTTVYVYEATNISQVTRSNKTGVYVSILTKRVASITTDSLGAFTIALPVGKYSLFIKMGDAYFANAFDQYNNICLIEVTEKKLTNARLVLNSNAFY